MVDRLVALKAGLMFDDADRATDPEKKKKLNAEAAALVEPYGIVTKIEKNRRVFEIYGRTFVDFQDALNSITSPHLVP